MWWGGGQTGFIAVKKLTHRYRQHQYRLTELMFQQAINWIIVDDENII